MTTIFYIIAVLGWLVTLVAACALGWAEGRKQGELDGYAEASGECGRRCAK